MTRHETLRTMRLLEKDALRHVVLERGERIEFHTYESALGDFSGDGFHIRCERFIVGRERSTWRHAVTFLEASRLAGPDKGQIVDYVLGTMRYLIAMVRERRVVFRLQRGPRWGRISPS